MTLLTQVSGVRLEGLLVPLQVVSGLSPTHSGGEGRGLQKPAYPTGDLSSEARSIFKLGSPKSVTFPNFSLRVGLQFFGKIS